MKWTLLILLLLLLPAADAVNYPQLRGFVTDNANMIDPVYEAKITELAQQIEKEDTVEIAVVTVDSLEGESKENYAVKLFEMAGIGKKDKDNGLLILVAKQEREYRFEVGYGLEGTITDSMKVNIGDRIIVPNFRNGDYGKGIYDAMVVVEGLVSGNQEVISQYSMPSNPPPPNNYLQQIDYPGLQINWGFIFFIVIVFIIIILNVMDRSRYDNEEWSRKHRYRERPVEIPIGGGWNWGSGGGGGWHSGGCGGFGGGFGGGGGGFGGFGGGRSGGGGFGGKW